ncbi:PHD finger protein Alfin1, partial [Mucuna pruriens]
MYLPQKFWGREGEENKNVKTKFFKESMKKKYIAKNLEEVGKRLFQMINDLPTIFELVTGSAKQSKDQPAAHYNGNKCKSSGKVSRQSESQAKGMKMSAPPKEEDESGEEEEDDEQGATCGACGDNYGNDEFWICCDMCERWFHGKCVKITPAKAEHIKQYKCPSCSNKRSSKGLDAARANALVQGEGLVGRFFVKSLRDLKRQFHFDLNFEAVT